MRSLFYAALVIGAACLFGPTPADAGTDVAVKASCSQPVGVNVQAAPVAVAATAVQTYSTPATFVQTPDTTVTIPGQRIEVPGQTVTVQGAQFVAQGVPIAAQAVCPYAVAAAVAVDVKTQVYRVALLKTWRANRETRLLKRQAIDGIELD